MAKPILVVDVHDADLDKIRESIREQIGDDYHIIVRNNYLTAGNIFVLNPDNIVGTIDVNELIEKLSKNNQ